MAARYSTREAFEQRVSELTDRQRRWLAHKAAWENMSQWAVLNEGWEPPADASLTPCGVSSCYGCELCIAAAETVTSGPA